MRGFGGGMGGLMAQAQKMQAKIAKVQEEIAAMEVAGESGGGAVKVVITGKHECKSVVIDPSVVDPEDVEMLQDLIQLAFNSAQTRLSEISEERMRKEVPLPPGMKLPFCSTCHAPHADKPTAVDAERIGGFFLQELQDAANSTVLH